MPQELTKELWLEWRDHPVTRDFFEKIEEKREGLLETLAYGSIETEKQQDRLVGRIAAMTDVMSTTYED